LRRSSVRRTRRHALIWIPRPLTSPLTAPAILRLLTNRKKADAYRVCPQPPLCLLKCRHRLVPPGDQGKTQIDIQNCCVPEQPLHLRVSEHNRTISPHSRPYRQVALARFFSNLNKKYVVKP